MAATILRRRFLLAGVNLSSMDMAPTQDAERN